MKAKEELKLLKAKTISELEQELREAKIKLANLKKDLLQEKLKKISEIKKNKKYIARIKTLIREKIKEDIIKEK